jgi:hypothetical protein
MSDARAAVVQQQMLISAVVNLVLSAAIFVLAFGLTQRTLAIAAPDNFALDFIPQSLILAFMSALLPALAVRSKRAAGAIAGVSAAAPSPGSLARSALWFAVLAAGVGVLLALITRFSTTQGIAWSHALIVKVIYGVVLGVAVTRTAVAAVLR